MKLLKSLAKYFLSSSQHAQMLGGTTNVADYSGESLLSGTQVVTPYDNAKAEWDNRIGSSALSAKNWRVCSFLLLFICILLVGLIYKLSDKPPIKPMLLEVEVETGKVAKVVDFNKVAYQPSEALTKHYLFNWVELLRAVPSDVVLLNQRLSKLYHFVTINGREKLARYIDDNHPFSKYNENITVEVKLHSINSISNSSYHIQWYETEFCQGKVIYKSLMASVITFKQGVPRDEDTLMVNPAGIWIDDFSFDKVKVIEEIEP